MDELNDDIEKLKENGDSQELRNLRATMVAEIARLEARIRDFESRLKDQKPQQE